MLFVIDEADLGKKLFPITEFTSLPNVFAGLFTIAERWASYLSAPVVGTAETFNINDSTKSYAGKLNPFILPTHALAHAIKALPANTALVYGHEIIFEPASIGLGTSAFNAEQYMGPLTVLNSLWDLVRLNSSLVKSDFRLRPLLVGESSVPTQCNIWGNASDIVFGKNLTCFGASFNTTDGPIVIGNNVLIMEGSYLRGPLYLGDETVVKMGAKIYGGSFQGKNTLGGEIKNSIALTGSNKAHDGYLGDSYLGAWCNFGAGATVSNVKNTAGEVLAHHVASGGLAAAGSKAGLLMGSFSRLAINSSINTGTVMGTCVNFFSAELSGKFIPSFSWGTEKYNFDKAILHIRNWMQFKGEDLLPTEKDKLFNIYSNT